MLQNSVNCFSRHPAYRYSVKCFPLQPGYWNPVYCECLFPGYRTLDTASLYTQVTQLPVNAFPFTHVTDSQSISCDSHTRVLDIPRVAYCYSHATELSILLISTLRLQNSWKLLPSRPRREKSCKLRLLHSGYRYPEYCDCLLPGCTTLVKCFSPHTEYRTSLTAFAFIQLTERPFATSPKLRL